MTISSEQLEAFHRFALVRIEQAKEEIELDALLLEWYDQQHRGEINETIRQGLADIENGKGKPATIVSQELRTKFGLPNQ
jgi:hypothetical protein